MEFEICDLRLLGHLFDLRHHFMHREWFALDLVQAGGVDQDAVDLGGRLDGDADPLGARADGRVENDDGGQSD